jgi:hypothetical protein
MAKNRGSMVRVLPLWIIACALVALIAFVVFSLFTRWAFEMWRKPSSVLLVGSGTVYNYLQEIAPSVLGKTSEDFKVSVLEGGTETGIKLLSDVYLHGTKYPEFAILAMASAKQEEKNFISLGGDKFFEAQIGEDNLKVTFGADATEKLSAAFDLGPNRLSEAIRNVGGVPAIRTCTLAHWVWRTCSAPWKSQPAYQVYVTSRGSATRALFEEAFKKCAGNNLTCWPQDEIAFDLTTIRAMTSRRPWIALGSRLLYKDRLDKLQASGLAHQLLVVDENDKPFNRGLFIYGRLHVGSERGRYDIDPRAASFLVDLFNALEKAASLNLIDGIFISRQEEFLHLEKGPPASGWIEEQAGSDQPVYIYRAKRD